jgi:hypothetical protein
MSATIVDTSSIVHMSGALATNPPTVIDVLENALGELSADRIALIGTAELDDLADGVNAFYDAWRTPELEEGDLRIYSGGWIAGNPESDEARQYLYTSLLYAPSVVIHDPIAEWFYPDGDRLESPAPIRGVQGGIEVQGAEPHLLRATGYYVLRDDPDRSRTFLAGAIGGLTALGSLIRQGIVVPIPAWQIVREQQKAILASVRHDVRDDALARLIDEANESPPRTDRIRGAEISPPGGVVTDDTQRAVVQNPSYYLNKTLALSEATSSKYIPPAAIDATLLEHKLKRVGDELRRRDIDLHVVAALGSLDLPFMRSLEPAVIASIRRDESAFEDWRATLRMTVRAIESNPSEGDRFAREARDVLNDVLVPSMREVERAVSHSRSMKAAAREQVIELGIGAVAVTGAAGAFDAPIAPAALAGLGISAAARWLYSSLFGPRPAGFHGILASLIRRK